MKFAKAAKEELIIFNKYISLSYESMNYTEIQ